MIHVKIKECLYLYPGGERTPLTAQSTAGQEASKGVPKSKQITDIGYSGRPPSIEMVNGVSNTLQGTDNGLASLHRCQGCLEPWGWWDYFWRR